MGRKPCCAKEGLNRGAWSEMEDQILTNYIKLHGEGQWRDLPQRAGLQRCGKSCRLRWRNYLRPDIKRGNISTEEDELIVKLHKLLGNRWSLIAGRLPGRTDNEIKNYWNTNLRKRLKDHSNNITPKPTKANDSNLQLNKIGKLQADNEHKVIRATAVKCTRAVNFNINIPRAYSLDNNHSATYKLEPKTENSTAREQESKSPSSSLIQNDENFTDLMMDFDINELLAPHASILDSHEMEQVVCENGNDVAGNAGYGHDFRLYMDDDFKVFSSMDEAKPDNLRAGTQLVQATPTSLELQSLEAYLNFEDELIN